MTLLTQMPQNVARYHLGMLIPKPREAIPDVLIRFSRFFFLSDFFTNFKNKIDLGQGQKFSPGFCSLAKLTRINWRSEGIALAESYSQSYSQSLVEYL